MQVDQGAISEVSKRIYFSLPLPQTMLTPCKTGRPYPVKSIQQVI